MLLQKMISIALQRKSRKNKAMSISSVPPQSPPHLTLVCNSGIGGPRMNPVKPQMSDDIAALQAHLWEPSFEAFQNTFSTNVTGVYFCCVAFLKLLHEGNKRHLASAGYSSQIVVMSSIAGYSKQIQSSVAYSASKAAATHLARNLATYFVNLQIRINVIVPGLYPSELTGSTKSDEKGHVSMEGREKLWDDVPAQRPGMEREIAGLGMFLARYLPGPLLMRYLMVVLRVGI
jgi:NAD(P)-dependent dehydrogenase (short-subunit alcohol dehydrogenase family)